MNETPVLIAGAGPTGLVLGLWLTRLGIAVRIVDKNSGPADYSRALGVQARTLEFYRQLGFADTVIERGVHVEAANFWVEGASAARVPLGEIGKGMTPFPFVLDFAQDVHERLLIDRLSALGVNVERDTELVGFEQNAEGVRARLRRGGSGTEETCSAAYLAGCDGAHSAVRQGLHIDFPGETYSQLFYVADVEARGIATEREIYVDVDQADLLVVFPMKGKGHIRLVGTVREEPGRQAKDPTFEDVSGRAIEEMHLTIERVNWFSPYRVHHRVAGSFRGGRAFLLGDAAHIHSPVGAQGMNTGIGDAVNLAWKLAAVVNQSAGESLLETYEPERIGFARRLVATTDRIFTIATRRGRLAAVVRTRVMPSLIASLMRASAIRRYFFRTISQIGVSYPGSALSVGRAGGVRGGDRLPWVAASAGEEDNFDPLRSIAWQVHVYGEPGRGVAETCEDLGLPLHEYVWKDAMKGCGLARGATYLVRPDGYVALADGGGDPKKLARYFADRRLGVAGRAGRDASGLIGGPRKSG
jgi:2-polyprenyl-6-methoxyphenol hydroxylase-like FAD-dependent oxidoreductase